MVERTAGDSAAGATRPHTVVVPWRSSLGWKFLACALLPALGVWRGVAGLIEVMPVETLADLGLFWLVVDWVLWGSFAAVLIATTGFALFLIYVGLGHLINRTRVMFDGQRVRWTYGPLPWRSMASAALEDVSGFEVRQASLGGTTARVLGHVLVARQRGGERRKLVPLIAHEQRLSSAASQLNEALEQLGPTQGLRMVEGAE